MKCFFALLKFSHYCLDQQLSDKFWRVVALIYLSDPSQPIFTRRFKTWTTLWPTISVFVT